MVDALGLGVSNCRLSSVRSTFTAPIDGCWATKAPQDIRARNGLGTSATEAESLAAAQLSAPDTLRITRVPVGVVAGVKAARPVAGAGGRRFQI